MKHDFIGNNGFLSLGARMKRVSDYLMHQSRNLYQELDLDIEPNWYLVIKLLEEHGTLSLKDISDHLYYSHPSVVNIVQKMKSADYLDIQHGKVDKRQRFVTLTEKAINNLPHLKRVWKAMEECNKQILEFDNAILKAIQQMENAYALEGYKSRINNLLKAEE